MPAPRFPSAFDCNTYKWRHLIENLFGKRKAFSGTEIRGG